MLKLERFKCENTTPDNMIFKLDFIKNKIMELTDNFPELKNLNDKRELLIFAARIAAQSFRYNDLIQVIPFPIHPV